MTGERSGGPSSAPNLREIPPFVPPAPFPGAVSPRVRRLERAVAVGETGAEERFWAEVDSTPLYEAGPRVDEVTTTLLVRSASEDSPIALIDGLVGPPDLGPGRMRRIPGTDVHALSVSLPSGWIASYGFAAVAPEDAFPAVLAQLTPDPLNPDRMPGAAGQPEKSVIGAGHIRAVTPVPQASRGTVTAHEIPCPTSGTRRIWVYVPAAPTPAGGFSVAVILDGDMWADALDLPGTLDALIATGAVPPALVLMPDSVDRAQRTSDLTGNPEYTRFLADDLLGWAADRWPIALHPERTLIGGASFGGLAACYAGLTRPDAFGLVLSQSGSFWFPNDADSEMLSRLFGAVPPPDIRLHLQYGTLETPNVAPTERFVATLREKGYRFSTQAYVGGHDRAWWREAIAVGLVDLLGRWQEQ